jgi:Calx-beta domain
VTVDYSTSNGTAIAGSDYTATSGTLTFAAGVTSRTFTIPIVKDTLDESDETVNLTLSNPTGGATIGASDTAVLTIIDNDTGGVLQFSSATYTVNEGVRSGKALIKVTRSGGRASGVSVDYTITDGTAVAGADYGAPNGTLTFNAGQTSKTFTIDIINDLVDEPNKSVNLVLSNPQGGSSLGARNTAVLNIVNNDIANVRGVYTLFPTSSLTLFACGIIPSLNGTFDTTGTINVSGQSGRNFSGTGTLFFTDSAATSYRLAATLSGTVAPGGEQLNGKFSFNVTIPPNATIRARGTGMFSGSLSGDTLTFAPAGQVTSGETCQLTGTLTGMR